ncbi:MAG: M20/M25/M40 family metallo-hydrolase, partial [Clostridia bacterium]|nr:M20/M25/M40 family metallo-hydrolase [Clostridia bacterium]
VCNIESPTDDKAGVDAVGAYFARWAEKLGFAVEVFKQPVSGDVVCITMNPKAPKPPICFSAHMDTVHPIGSFGTPAVTVDEAKIYGPGVTDCKGGAVAAALAMEALLREGFSDRPIMLLLQSDEENGSRKSNKATISYICEKAKGSDAFFNLEGGSPGEACLFRKGIVTYRFKVYGKEAHSSRCAVEGANAIAEVAHKILALEKHKDAEGITFSCNVIGGGTVPNTVAGYCEFLVNVRYASAQQLEWVRSYVNEVAQTAFIEGTHTKVEQVSFRLAMPYEERNEALLEKINAIYAENGLPTLKKSKRTGGSDAADVTSCGIPCIDSLGVEGGEIHSRGEFAWLKTLTEAAKRVASAAYCL